MSAVSFESSSRRTQAWLAYAWLRLGRPGQCGVVLLLAAVLVAALGWGLNAQADQLEAERLALGRMAARAARPAASRSPAAEAQDLIARLAPPERVPLFIEGLHREAQRAGLEVERAEYRSPALAGGQVVRSQVVLPVRGNYPAITLWLATVLHDHPSAAIDELSLQRDAPGSASLRARFVISHYSRARP